MDIRTSPLVEMASESKRPTRWWLGWIVAVVIILAGGILGQSLGSVILGNPQKQDTLYQFNDFFGFGVTLLLLFLWVRLKEGRPFSSVGFRGRKPIGKLLIGVVIGAAMMSAGVLIAWATGQIGTGLSVHTNLGPAALLPIVILLLVFFVQAGTEEAMTRGYMLQIGGRDINGWVAILATSIIFTAIHPGITPVAGLNIALYAVFASFVALGQGNLWLIVGIHIGWNYAQGNIFGIPVSGNPTASSLLDFGPTQGSNDLVTGGTFGLEASLIGTLILVIALAIAFTAYRRTEARRVASTSAPETSLPDNQRK